MVETIHRRQRHSCASQACSRSRPQIDRLPEKRPQHSAPEIFRENDCGHRSEADSLNVLLGNYNGTPSSYTTILDGIRKRFRNAKILTALGAPVTETSAVLLPSVNLRTGGTNSQPGLNAEYFANVNLSGTPVLKRVDAGVDFEWNNVSPGPGVPAGNYSVRWTGELVPPVDGDYRLGASTDGGYRLYL